MSLRPLVAEDWPVVRAIYHEGIASGDATFETGAPPWDDWHGSRLAVARIVAEDAGRIVGFAALSPISNRDVYAGVAEVMVYVTPGAQGRGIGGQLMARLVEESEAAGIWTLQASIFPENEASIRAHLRVGFREIGRRERIGRFLDGRWRDTLLFERRSASVGLD